MKKLILSFAILSAILLMASCTVSDTTYSPGYNSDYVYSVGYSGYQPYWGNRSYSGYGLGSGWGNNWYGTRSYYGIGGNGYYGRGGFHTRGW